MAKAQSKAAPRPGDNDAAWNVAFDDDDGNTNFYLAAPTSRRMAALYRGRFKEIYIDSSPPNGRYPFKNPRVVPVTLSQGG